MTQLKIGTKVKLVNPEDFDFDEDDSGEGYVAQIENTGGQDYLVEFSNGLKRWVYDTDIEVITKKNKALK